MWGVAAVAVKDEDGCTPLDIAMQNDHLEVAQLLLLEVLRAAQAGVCLHMHVCCFATTSRDFFCFVPRKIRKNYKSARNGAFPRIAEEQNTEIKKNHV